MKLNKTQQKVANIYLKEYPKKLPFKDLCNRLPNISDQSIYSAIHEMVELGFVIHGGIATYEQIQYHSGRLTGIGKNTIENSPNVISKLLQSNYILGVLTAFSAAILIYYFGFN